MAPNASQIAMRHLDLTLPSPAENLACDEALLDWCEENSGIGFQPVQMTSKQAGGAVPLPGGEGILRFWESPELFVVVGYANKVSTEVDMAACEARKIPILRRCSGGGTVVQGPGCLNYTLVLPITKDGPLHSIAVANQFIMRHNRAAIESVGRVTPCAPLNGWGEATDEPARGDARPTIGGQRTGRVANAIAIRGHTDLAIGEKKFSGNSQRRRKHFLLFHGTFLLNFDLALIGYLLRMPSTQPNYRESRKHADFLTNINAPAEQVKAAMQNVWDADAPLENPPLDKITSLARETYLTNEWNFKFP
jgi:lipoate-protein ligase A